MARITISYHLRRRKRFLDAEALRASESSSASTRLSSRATLSTRFFLAINSSDGLGAGGEVEAEVGP